MLGPATTGFQVINENLGCHMNLWGCTRPLTRGCEAVTEWENLDRSSTRTSPAILQGSEHETLTQLDDETWQGTGHFPGWTVGKQSSFKGHQCVPTYPTYFRDAKSFMHCAFLIVSPSHLLSAKRHIQRKGIRHFIPLISPRWFR